MSSEERLMMLLYYIFLSKAELYGDYGSYSTRLLAN